MIQCKELLPFEAHSLVPAIIVMTWVLPSRSHPQMRPAELANENRLA
jgi:hypothetical protein